MKLHHYIPALLLATFESNALNGNGIEPPGDVYYCVEDSKYFLIGTEDVSATFAKIDKEWACLSSEHLKLCKDTTVMVFKMNKEGYSDTSIKSEIYSKGAWTAGNCKDRD